MRLVFLFFDVARLRNTRKVSVFHLGTDYTMSATQCRVGVGRYRHTRSQMGDRAGSRVRGMRWWAR
jgi:hypothetical protein